LKSHFAKSTGYQTQRQKKDPIHKAGSLDCPLDPTNPEGTTLGEVIPSTVDPIQAVEERMYQEWRSERMTHELEKLPPEQGEIIRLRYYKELSAAEIGEVTDATALEVRKRERAALDTLRRSKEIQFMHRLESNTNYFFHVGAHSGLSPVEEIVQRRETLLERWNAEGTPNNYD
jgi:RNA polymerase sigma factor (sigma-70 family)